MQKKQVKDYSEVKIELAEKLFSEYKRWKDIYENGCEDPTYPDGVNLNLVRNHIINTKKKIEQIFKDQFWFYPRCYYYPTPPKLPQDFMAVDRKFISARKEEEYRANKTLPYHEVMSFKYVLGIAD